MWPSQLRPAYRDARPEVLCVKERRELPEAQRCLGDPFDMCDISCPMESKGAYGAPPPNYMDSVQPPSYQGAAGYPPYPAGPPMEGHPPYPVGPPMGGPGIPAPQHANPPVVVQTVYVQPTQHFSFQPMQTTCPSCNQVVVTRISHSAGALTWISCGGLFLVGDVLISGKLDHPATVSAC
ncbi:lipopolysaccharide-induced tumor necrosis factor-alpha factor homolog isoform X2 [Cetorhinus maximus]